MTQLLSISKLFGVGVFLLAGTTFVPAQEATPVKPDAADAKEAEEKEKEAEKINPLDGLQPLSGGGGDPIEQLIDEMSSNMKTIEELLNQGQTGASTQDVQTKTIETIDQLIKEVEKRCSSCSSSSGSGSKQASQSQGKQPKDQKRSNAQRKLEERTKQEQLSQQQKQQQQKGEPRNPENSPNNQTREGQLPPDKAGKLTGRQGQGRWGRLPGKVVEQMYDNGKRKLPERYRVLLEEYFRRLPLSEGQ